jgi:hypothetical protein
MPARPAPGQGSEAPAHETRGTTDHQAATGQQDAQDMDGNDGLESAHLGALPRRLAADVAAGGELDRVDRAAEQGDDGWLAGPGTGSGNRERLLADAGAGGPLGDPGPLVVSMFEAANDRHSRPLERILLAELERDADPAARAAGSTGADWIVAALREAVASGSTFVAPKRIREIVNRWSASGDGPRGPYQQADARPEPAPAALSLVDSAPLDVPEPPADVRLPGGASGNAVWSAVLEDLTRLLDRAAFDRLLAGSRMTRYWRGTVEVSVPSAAAAGKLSAEYRALVERQLNARLSRPVGVRFEAAPGNTTVVAATESTTVCADADLPLHALSRADLEAGRQLWRAVLDDLAPSLALDDRERVKGVVPLGEYAGGALLLGAPSGHARRLVEGRLRAELERALAALLGRAVSLRVVDGAAWTIRD